MTSLLTKVYGIVGKALSAVAGAIVGFMAGGIPMAALGLLSGLHKTRLLEYRQLSLVSHCTAHTMRLCWHRFFQYGT